MIVLALFIEFVVLSFVAFGGATALLPEMHRVVVLEHGWLDDTTFTHLYAIAQAAPGPNVLVVTLIGWKVAGLAGALATTLAMCLPMSVLIYLLIDGILDDLANHRRNRICAERLNTRIIEAIDNSLVIRSKSPFANLSHANPLFPCMDEH